MLLSNIKADQPAQSFPQIIRNIHVMKNPTRVGLSIIEVAGIYADPHVFSAIRHNLEFAEALDAFLSSPFVTSIQRGHLLPGKFSSPNYWAKVVNPLSRPRIRQIPMQRHPGNFILTFPDHNQYQNITSFATATPESLYAQFAYQVFTRENPLDPIVLNFSYGPGTMIQLIIRYNRNELPGVAWSKVEWGFDDSIEFSALELHPYGFLSEPNGGNIIFGRSRLGETFKNFASREYNLHMMAEKGTFLAEIFHEMYLLIRKHIERTPKTILVDQWFHADKNKQVSPFSWDEHRSLSEEDAINHLGEN